MSLKKLINEVSSGNVDTVLIATPDMFGRLIGRVFDAKYFIQAPS